MKVKTKGCCFTTVKPRQPNLTVALPGVQTHSVVHILLCSETPHNTQEPVPALSGETAHYSASDDCCCWSIL